MTETQTDAVKRMIDRAGQRSGDVSRALRLYQGAAERAALVPAAAAQGSSSPATGANAFAR